MLLRILTKTFHRVPKVVPVTTIYGLWRKWAWNSCSEYSHGNVWGCTDRTPEGNNSVKYLVVCDCNGRFTINHQGTMEWIALPWGVIVYRWPDSVGWEWGGTMASPSGLTQCSIGVWDHGLMTRLVSDRPRSWSYTFGLGLGLAALVLVLVLVLYFWSCLKHCYAQQALCDMVMLKCNKHLYFSCNKCRNSAKCNWSSYHFLTFFAQSYFLITNMCAATEEFFFVM